MKRLFMHRYLVTAALLLIASAGHAADTCEFTVSGADNPPKIVLLLDNSVEMEEVAWHSDYNNNIDFTPVVPTEYEVVQPGAGGSGGAPDAPASYTILELTSYDESYPFEVGAEVEGVSSGAVASVVSKTYTGGELHLEIDSVVGTFQVGETVQRYKNKNSIATGTLDAIVTPVPPPPPPPGITVGDRNGFFNDLGYGIVSQGGDYYLVKVLDDLTLDTYGNGLAATVSVAGASATFAFTAEVYDYATNSTTPVNVSLTVPPEADTVANPDGILDKVNSFRYSKNYLNWLAFSRHRPLPGVTAYFGDGTDLPKVSRFWWAKKAIFTVALQAENRAEFAIYNYVSTTEGASSVQPLGLVLDGSAGSYTIQSNFENNINNMATVTYAPLAEALGTVGGYFQSPSSGIDEDNFCAGLFVIVVTPGFSSKDQGGAMASNKDAPGSLADYDGDDGTGEIGEGKIQADSSMFDIPVKYQGSTYLDDAAYYLYTHDIVPYVPGFQNVSTYTIGFMGNRESNLYLINTSNNGNGNVNLYDTNDKEYGKYHFVAESPAGLAEAISAAVDAILSRTTTFTAPVVPVTRTTSGNTIYMAFFKPKEGTFWEGNVVKFGLNAQNQIIDIHGNLATYPNGALIETAVPYWRTVNWGDASFPNYMENRTGYSDSRKIYTYLGTSTDLTHSSNAFETTNSLLTTSVLNHPTAGVNDVINYVRGADVLDENADGNIDKNRQIITGDVLHSEPAVVRYNDTTTIVYFGANDGMLHAVLDANGTEHWAFIPPDQLKRLKLFLEGFDHIEYVDFSPKIYIRDWNGNGDIDTGNTTIDYDGDGTFGDAGDQDLAILVCGYRKGGKGYFALDVTDPDTPKLLWRIGPKDDTRTGRLVLDGITGDWTGDYLVLNKASLGLWNYHYGPGLNGNEFQYSSRYGNYAQVGDIVAVYDYNGTDWVDTGGRATVAQIYEDAPYGTGPITTGYSYFGESWSEPKFGRVKTSDSDTVGTPAMFVGGGYSDGLHYGAGVYVINVMTGYPVMYPSGNSPYNFLWYHTNNQGETDSFMYYPIPSAVTILDENSNGFIDKIYVGDLRGQLWRIGQVKYDAAGGETLTFPRLNENIHSWTAKRIFTAPTGDYVRKFYYPPSVTLEKGYDLLFIGTGDRENDVCDVPAGADRIYAVADDHSNTVLTELNLVDVTDVSDPYPSLDNPAGDADANGYADKGWYIRMVDANGDPSGEKILAEGTVFFKVYYITTFTPTTDVCVPGGIGKLYALKYKTGQPALFTVTDAYGEETEVRALTIGGGIPSKAVTVITEDGQKLFISIGSTNPDDVSGSQEAGIIAIDPLAPTRNFFYLWWRELFN